MHGVHDKCFECCHGMVCRYAACFHYLVYAHAMPSREPVQMTVDTACRVDVASMVLCIRVNVQ